MNSLTLGFFYVCGMSWALAECALRAAYGNPLPLLLFVLAFVVVFAIMGCLPVSDKTINTTGSVGAVLLAVTLAVFTLESWTGHAPLLASLLKTVFMAIFAAGAILPFVSKNETAGHSRH